MLGYAADALGVRPAAQAHFEESAAIARALGDKERLSFALNALAGHHAETDDLDLAEPLYEEALTLAREMHDLESIALDLPNLARVLVDRGDAELVRAMLQEALAIAQEIGSTRAAQNVVEVAVGLAILRCDWERAARFYGAVQAQMEELGLRRTPVDDAFLAGRIGKVRAAIGDAAFEVAEAGGRSLSLEEGLGEARVWLEQRD
jgi:tetratricopeptide (TPR) repeat protein